MHKDSPRGRSAAPPCIHVGKEQVASVAHRAAENPDHEPPWDLGAAEGRLSRGATVGKPSSVDVVRRRLKADAPDRLWTTDITEHPTREGKLHFCAATDAFSRMLVSRSIDGRQTGRVTNVLGMALNRRAPREAGTIHFEQAVHSN